MTPLENFSSLGRTEKYWVPISHTPDTHTCRMETRPLGNWIGEDQIKQEAAGASLLLYMQKGGSQKQGAHFSSHRQWRVGRN